MQLRNRITLAATAASLVAFGIAAAFAADDDKYTLVSPGKIAFSEFKGYENWAFISSARTDKELKVIVANPVMINAFKAGAPANGQPFPEGSKVAKLQWTFKKSTEAQFVVDV